MTNDFDKLEKETNGGEVFINGDLLYKSFKNNPCFIAEKERNTKLMYEKRFFPPYIVDIFYEDDNFVGYSQEYILGSLSFKEAIDDDRFTKEEKIKAICDVFQSVKTLHENDIYLGDAHSENFLITEDGGYLIDLDEVRFKDIDDFKFEDFYVIKYDKDTPYIKVADPKTDTIKVTVSSLSLLYGIDLEEIIKDNTIDNFLDYLDALIEDGDFKEQIFKIFDRNEDAIYLDDILNNTKRNGMSR